MSGDVKLGAVDFQLSEVKCWDRSGYSHGRFLYPVRFSEPRSLVFIPETRRLMFLERKKQRVLEIDLNTDCKNWVQETTSKGRALAVSAGGQFRWIATERRIRRYNHDYEAYKDDDKIFIAGTIQYWLDQHALRKSYRDGPAASAEFYGHNHMIATSDGRYAYVSDRFNHRIRLIDAKDQCVTTVAGDGREYCYDHKLGGLELGSIREPSGLCFDTTTNVPESVIYVNSYSWIRKLVLAWDLQKVLTHVVNQERIGSRTWSSLLYDLWKIVANYLVVPSSLTTVTKSDLGPRSKWRRGNRGREWSSQMAMLPSGCLLTASKSQLWMVHTEDGPDPFNVVNGVLMVSYPPDQSDIHATISGIAIDTAKHCVYISDQTSGSIHSLTLPSHYFVPPQN